MATIVEYDGKQYLITCCEPETEWVSMLAKSMGMTKETVVAAALNQGLTHYVGMIAQIAEHELNKDKDSEETDKPTSEAKDHKTYDKGSCKG